MSQRHWKIIACLFLVLATLTVYGEIRNHQFIYFDDDVYVTDNPPVHGGLTLKGLAWAFTTMHAGNWHPLTWLSYMVDSQFFGLHPGAFLLSNLLFHIANALLLFLWLQRTTRALGRSFLVAALFALHPLHVESVAWVTERKDVLSTFFWLLTMWAYVWYVERPVLRRYLLILGCFSLGLMAKPMLVTLPLILLLLDYWPLGRLSLHRPATAGRSRASQDQKTGQGVAIKRLVWEKAPLLVLTALFSIVTLVAQKNAGAVMPLERFPLTVRLANALVAYVSYMGKMIWPTCLAVFYPHPGDTIPLWQWLGAGLTLAVLSLLIIWQTRRRPYLLVGWLWYLGTLVPVSGLVQVGEQAMADRFTYVPLIGLFIIGAWGMVDLTSRWRAARGLLPLGAGVVLSAFMLCTLLQVRHWADSISLFDHDLRVARNNPLAHNNLGGALLLQGQAEQAMAHYAEALRLKPNYAEAHNNLGNALFSQGQVAQAMAHYAEALRLRPNYAEAHNNLGLALLSQGKAEEGMAHYAEALRLRPNYGKAHNNLGNALASQGQVVQAMAHYAEALRLRPDYAEAHYNLGLALVSQGQVEQAMAHYAEALCLRPDYVEAYNGLGIALANQGKIDEAIGTFQKAIQLNPNFSDAYNNLGLVFAKQGDIDKAIATFQKAVQINPNNTGAQKMLSIFKAQRPRE